MKSWLLTIADRLLFFKNMILIIFFSQHAMMESLSPEKENIIKNVRNL